MLVLAGIGLIAGMVTSISPCILPVLPVVLAGSAPSVAAPPGVRSWRPVGVVAGLVVSFCLSTLLGSFVLDALGLPQDLLRDVGIVVLALVGFGMVVPWAGELLERPFARLRGRPVDPNRNGLVVGLGAGLLFVPCAGPVLATIALVGATHMFGADALVLTAAFGVGVGVPLLVIALAGAGLMRRVGMLRRRARGLRTGGGYALIAVAIALGFDLTDGLQQLVPSYAAALQPEVEVPGAPAPAAPAPATTAPAVAPVVATDGPCVEGSAVPADCGPAPAFAGIDTWLNTPGGKPLDLAALRGKVVLVDFWTYSCINCQRSLPHREAWYRTYADAGLVVIGVHTPEFAFERVPANVAAQARTLGVEYPIAIDNRYATWNAYANRYWPAEYLVDAGGTIRAYHFGEGRYDETERLIRQLLVQADPGRVLPPPTDVVDGPAPSILRTPETYLGYRYPQEVSGSVPARDRTRGYVFPPELRPDTFALSGSWRAGPQALTAGSAARLQLSFQAGSVNLVLGGTGTVTAEVNGTVRTVRVGGPPTLYELASGIDNRRTTITLTLTPGLQAYSFTFG